MPVPEENSEDGSLKRVTSKFKDGYDGETVVIAEPETITPIPSPAIAPVDSDHSHPQTSPKQYRTNASRRLSGRPAEKSTSSLHSIPSLSSLKSIPTLDLPVANPSHESVPSDTKPHSTRDAATHIISQVAQWLQQEKSRRATHRSKRHAVHGKLHHAADAANAVADHFRGEGARHGMQHHVRRDSELSEGALALEKLEQILSQSMNINHGHGTPGEDMKESYFSHRKPSRKESTRKLMQRRPTAGSSDSEHPDNELLVPSAEVVLDNSRTLGYSGGDADSELDLNNHSKRVAREKEAWKQFKTEIVTLTHTLKISGWRRVPIEQSGDIDVERLCGALTNAVYVVSPPKTIPQTPATVQADAAPIAPKRPPPKLLLRIYGPQVEHLIDRESELQILRRLARKKIGPRLLGTFTNGRFEQYFYAKTLTATDLRIPETSKQIAKRMRELHDGIELLKEEREGGPFIWKNWNSWVDRCGEITSWLDKQVPNEPFNPRSKDWKKRGLVCGVEWDAFRQTVERYRKWLLDQYGSAKVIEKNLVFAHNDTQYGNLLRLQPSGESPLLLPANEHKQLIVIDFEYASANPPGLEFANHFTEWCYNYHNPTASYVLNEKTYPTPEEQTRFLKAYIQHRSPSNQPSRTDSNPALTPAHSTSGGPGGSISSFMLDSRAPPTPGGYAEEERQRDEALEREIEILRKEIRLWRVANSAQWVAWGIVQAKIPGMDEALEAAANVTSTSSVFAAQGKDTSAAAVEGTELSARNEDEHEHAPDRQTLGSDPLTPETKPLAESARNKRPEARELSPSSSRLTTPLPSQPPANDGSDHPSPAPLNNENPENPEKEEKEENPEKEEEEKEDDEEAEFDYLGYAQQRALFFWGDVLQLGLVQLEELPVALRERVKVVEY